MFVIKWIYPEDHPEPLELFYVLNIKRDIQEVHSIRYNTLSLPEWEYFPGLFLNVFQNFNHNLIEI